MPAGKRIFVILGIGSFLIALELLALSEVSRGMKQFADSLAASFQGAGSLVDVVSAAAKLSRSLPTKHPANADAGPAPLDLTVVLPKNIFPLAERIPVFIKLSNKSDHEVLVGRYLIPVENAPSYLQVTLEDETGRSSPGPVVYLEMNTNAVRAWWLGLPPAHSYGFDSWLDKVSYPILDKPGKYCIIAKYISSGAKELSGKSKDAGNRTKPPAKLIPWRGELKSSPVCIEVIP